MKSEVKMDRFINPEPWTIVSCRDNNCKDNALSIGLVANVSIEPEFSWSQWEKKGTPIIS